MTPPAVPATSFTPFLPRLTTPLLPASLLLPPRSSQLGLKPAQLLFPPGVIYKCGRPGAACCPQVWAAGLVSQRSLGGINSSRWSRLFSERETLCRPLFLLMPQELPAPARCLLSADGKVFFNLWFMPHRWEGLAMFKSRADEVWVPLCVPECELAGLFISHYYTYQLQRTSPKAHEMLRSHLSTGIG